VSSAIHQVVQDLLEKGTSGKANTKLQPKDDKLKRLFMLPPYLNTLFDMFLFLQS
jgi:hypothetical protein